MNQEAITHIENNFQSFNGVKFLKELNLQNIKVAKDIFKKAIDAIADRNMRQRKNAELTKWARDVRKHKHNIQNPSRSLIVTLLQASEILVDSVSSFKSATLLSLLFTIDQNCSVGLSSGE